MTPSQIPDAIYQERTALLDRIKHYESSARHFNEDWGATMIDAVEHIAYAKTRLDRIDNMIANFAGTTHA